MRDHSYVLIGEVSVLSARVGKSSLRGPNGAKGRKCRKYHRPPCKEKSCFDRTYISLYVSLVLLLHFLHATFANRVCMDGHGLLHPAPTPPTRCVNTLRRILSSAILNSSVGCIGSIGTTGNHWVNRSNTSYAFQHMKRWNCPDDSPTPACVLTRMDANAALDPAPARQGDRHSANVVILRGNNQSAARCHAYRRRASRIERPVLRRRVLEPHTSLIRRPSHRGVADHVRSSYCEATSRSDCNIVVTSSARSRATRCSISDIHRRVQPFTKRIRGFA